MVLSVPQDMGDSRRLFTAGHLQGIAGKAWEQAAPLANTDSATEITSARSRWLYRRCGMCGHSFRVGDRVRVGPGDEVVHAMLGLCGAGAAEAAAEAGLAERAALQEAFFAGLERACPRPAGVVVLEAGHPLLAPPQPGFPRRTCQVCGHSFREGELAVICSCSPGAPRCRMAVHRDHYRQLWCWDEWLRAHPVGTKRPCLSWD